MRDPNTFTGMLVGLAVIWGILTVLGAGYLVELYLTTSGKIQIEKLMVGTLPIMGGVLVWASAWSLLAYIVKRKLFFHFQLIVSSAYILLALVIENIVDYFEYNISNQIIVERWS